MIRTVLLFLAPAALGGCYAVFGLDLPVDPVTIRVDGMDATGDIALIEPPRSTRRGALESESIIYAFVERTLVLEEDVVLDLVGRGSWSGGDDRPDVSVEDRTIEAGTEVRSVYLHFDPANDRTATGTIDVGGKVLGILSDNISLWETDEQLGHSDTKYAGEKEDWRGSLWTDAGEDEVEVSGSKVTVTFNTGESDAIRVLVGVGEPEVYDGPVYFTSWSGDCDPEDNSVVYEASTIGVSGGAFVAFYGTYTFTRDGKLFSRTKGELHSIQQTETDPSGAESWADFRLDLDWIDHNEEYETTISTAFDCSNDTQASMGWVVGALGQEELPKYTDCIAWGNRESVDKLLANINDGRFFYQPLDEHGQPDGASVPGCRYVEN